MRHHKYFWLKQGDSSSSDYKKTIIEPEEAQYLTGLNLSEGRINKKLLQGIFLKHVNSKFESQLGRALDLSLKNEPSG